MAAGADASAASGFVTEVFMCASTGVLDELAGREECGFTPPVREVRAWVGHLSYVVGHVHLSTEAVGGPLVRSSGKRVGRGLGLARWARLLDAVVDQGLVRLLAALGFGDALVGELLLIRRE